MPILNASVVVVVAAAMLPAFDLDRTQYGAALHAVLKAIVHVEGFPVPPTIVPIPSVLPVVTAAPVPHPERVGTVSVPC